MAVVYKNDGTYHLSGPSSQSKPVLSQANNGSLFTETDTGITFVFDYKTKSWTKLSTEISVYINNVAYNSATYANEHIYCMSGSSSDKKPKLGLSSAGSRFIETDSGNVYIYDAKAKKWNKLANSSGGGSYSAGDGIKINGTEISVDTTKIATVDELDKKSVVIANAENPTKQLSTISIDGEIYTIVTELPANVVKTDTNQTINGEKIFTNGLTADKLNAGDFYFDSDNIYAKDDATGEYEPVIGNVVANEELGTTDGHVFNDTTNTAYIAGNTTNPKYVIEDENGNTVISDIALISDIPAQQIVEANPDEQATAELNKIKIDDTVYSIPTGGTEGADENSFVFTEDLTTMYNVGKIEASTDNPVTIPAAGKSFKQVWNEMFVNIINPEVIQPSWTVYYSESDVTGAYFTPTVTLTFNTGSYSYGPSPTGVEITALTINGELKTLVNNSITLTLDEIKTGDTINIESIYSYANAAVPVNNINVQVPELKIADVENITAEYAHTFTSIGTLTVNTPTPTVSVSTVTEAEVGTIVTPTYTIGLNYATGNYPNGSVEYPTDKSANVVSSMTKNINNGESVDTTTGTFNFNSITLTDSTQAQTIKANVSYTASDRTPLSAKGNRVPDKKIAAGTVATAIKTCTIPAGYRKIFWGYSTADTIDSDTIRALVNSKKNAKLTNEFLDEDVNAKYIIIAAPTGTRTLTKVTMPSSSEADVTSQFVKQSTTINVAGANEFTAKAYDVWVYSPAVMGGTYKINMG